MLTSLLISTLALCLVVSANAIVARDNMIRVPFSKRVNMTRPGLVLKQDQARARAIRSREPQKSAKRLLKKAIGSVPVQNQAVQYVANVGIGTPATTYSLIIDTGSSNTWVGAGKAFVQTTTSVQTSNLVCADYSAGTFGGTEFTDTFSLGDGLAIKAQSFGVASFSQGFEGVDGILGLGPVDLTIGTLATGSASAPVVVNEEIPTVTDNLFSQGVISSHEVSISFEPATSLAGTNGELTFGGTDSSKFTGSITFAPITSISPSNEFWGINQSVRYGTSTNILTTTAGIVDAGMTLILLATDAFLRYEAATGGVLDEATGLLRVTPAQFNTLQSLFFNINGVQFELTANAQAWPRSLNSAIGGNSNSVYLIVNDLGSPSGEGLDFINGFAFLERFYTVLDTANQRVGFANTPFTHATTN
ncbi:acid protease [Schizopora paradoxa]|uniref:Acid protease n=1 Tax=Schizopora paradoxa TaxID=27342 RepID=A0A0H2RBV9_9AGAM|nr:acid protease [Schizopora paradoxa]